MQFLSPIHTDEALGQAENIADRRRLTTCEIKRSGEISGGGGEADGPDINAGRVRCAVSQGGQGDEGNGGGGDPEAKTVYEIAITQTVMIQPDDRIAIPGFYPQWEPGKNYAFKSLIAQTNWVSGAVPILKCVSPGATAAKEPKRWPTKIGATIRDGGAIWRVVGRAVLYEVIAVNANESNRVETIVRCKEIN